jgi:hypothetical protein
VTDAKLAPISAVGKIANSATTATSANVPNTIVSRDATSSFAASVVNTGTMVLSGTFGVITHDGQRLLYRAGGGLPANSSIYLGIDAGPAPGAPTPLENTGVGSLALRNVQGTVNTAIGISAARNITTANANTVVGAYAMEQGTTSSANVVVGYQAGRVMTGSRNIVIGADAGSALTAGDFNVLIGNAGATESNTIRIGTQGTHLRTFVAGIFNSNVTGGVAVQVASDGQLGVVQSSARFKTDIRDLESSNVLHRLRPVSFRYRPDIDASGAMQYGLIAEEVDRVAPELVVRDSTGRPYTVRYGMLVPMLVNEVTQLDREIASVARQYDEVRRRIERLEAAASKAVKP